LLESLADKIIFLYQPQKYGFLEDEEGNSLRGHAEIILEKTNLARLAPPCAYLMRTVEGLLIRRGRG